MSYYAMQGLGQDPAPVDVSSWWTQAQQWAQQNMPGGVPSVPGAPSSPGAPSMPADPTGPYGPQEPPAQPLPPGSTSTVKSDDTTTYVVAGAIAVVGIAALVYILK